MSSHNAIIIDCVQIRSIVLLNCGGIIDLREMLQLKQDVKCYVVDSHRPIHLSNVHGDEQV